MACVPTVMVSLWPLSPKGRWFKAQIQPAPSSKVSGQSQRGQLLTRSPRLSCFLHTSVPSSCSAPLSLSGPHAEGVLGLPVRREVQTGGDVLGAATRAVRSSSKELGPIDANDMVATSTVSLSELPVQGLLQQGWTQGSEKPNFYLFALSLLGWGEGSLTIL